MRARCYSQPPSPLKHLQSYPQTLSQMSDHLGSAAVGLKAELLGENPWSLGCGVCTGRIWCLIPFHVHIFSIYICIHACVCKYTYAHLKNWDNCLQCLVWSLQGTWVALLYSELYNVNVENQPWDTTQILQCFIFPLDNVWFCSLGAVNCILEIWVISKHLHWLQNFLSHVLGELLVIVMVLQCGKPRHRVWSIPLQSHCTAAWSMGQETGKAASCSLPRALGIWGDGVQSHFPKLSRCMHRRLNLSQMPSELPTAPSI